MEKKHSSLKMLADSTLNTTGISRPSQIHPPGKEINTGEYPDGCHEPMTNPTLSSYG
jgi:hypothetical protein